MIYPESSLGLIVLLIQHVFMETCRVCQALFHPLPHLILIPTMGSRLSYPHFTDVESKPQRLNDLPAVIKPAEASGTGLISSLMLQHHL